MRRLMALPLIFAVFFGPIGSMPGHETGSVQAATVTTVETPTTTSEIVARQEEPEAESKDTPWAIVLPLAILIPLAVLLIPAFFLKRTPGH